jgi:hypothetical protein
LDPQHQAVSPSPPPGANALLDSAIGVDLDDPTQTINPAANTCSSDLTSMCGPFPLIPPHYDHNQDSIPNSISILSNLLTTPTRHQFQDSQPIQDIPSPLIPS